MPLVTIYNTFKNKKSRVHMCESLLRTGALLTLIAFPIFVRYCVLVMNFSMQWDGSNAMPLYRALRVMPKDT